MAENRSRRWTWTLNNYTTKEEDELKKYFTENSTFTIWEHEVGENKTPHLQGYTVFESDKRLNTLKQINNRIHWEKSRGTNKQNIDYCTKDNCNIVTIGEEPKGQGHRSDLDELHKDLKNGMSMKDISNNHFGSFMRYNKSILLYKLYNNTEKPVKPEVTVITGPTGCGKTYYANAIEGNKYWKSPSNKWWDGYDGQEIIILDEMKHSKDTLTIEDMLRILDEYEKTGEVKGGTINLNPKKIIITSNYQPYEWYPFASRESIKALYRRIDTYIYKDKTQTIKLEATKERRFEPPEQYKPLIE